MAKPEVVESFGYFGTDVSKLVERYTSADTAGTSLVTGRTDRALRQASAVGAELTLTIASRSTITVGFAYKPTTVFSFAPYKIFEFRDAGAVQNGLAVNGSGQLFIYRGNGSFGSPGTAVVTSTNALSQNTYHYIEVKINTHSSTGTADVQVNNSATGWISATGLNTQATGSASVNAYAFKTGGTSFDAFSGEFDDFYLNADGDTTFRGDRRMYTFFPNADGSLVQWTLDSGSTHYTQLDDDPHDGDTSYAEDSTPGNQELLGFTNMSTTPISIDCVAVMGAIKKDDAGARSVALVAKSGATTLVGATQALSTSYKYYVEVYGEDPDTASPWTKSGVDAAEFGFETKA